MLFISKKEAVRKAVYIGGMCSISYLAVYIARNILGTVSPELVEKDIFTEGQIGSLSSIYFICYGIGQLINGAIGDKIKTKYMISAGLCLAGICNLLFALFSDITMAAFIVYGLTGFFLSMIYGPMTKLVAENTEPVYATRCSLGYTVASFLGSPAAGLISAVIAWRGVFTISTAILIFMGITCFIVFSIMEKRGIIKYNQYAPPKEKGGSIKILIKHKIIKFTFISIITGVVRTSVVFWLPTYLSQYLNFSTKNSKMIFSVATLIISFTAFVAIFIYERLNRNMDLTILIAFISATVCFTLVYSIGHKWVNVTFMVLAIMSSNCAASMLWSRYCPSLRDTGVVSSATGFLDFVSYMAAAASSALFGNAVSIVGWGNLILIWLGLMIAGVIVALPFDKFKKKKA